MIGQAWPSEKHTFKDEKTGRTVTQLTTTGNNVHLYFTENSLTALETRSSIAPTALAGEMSRQKGQQVYNLFRMDLGTGETVQLTDEPTSVGGVTKTPTATSSSLRQATRSRNWTPEAGR